MKKRISIPVIILILLFSTVLIIPNNVSTAFAKTTTLKELKKIKKENYKMHEKQYLTGYWVCLYKCKGKVIRWDEYISGTGISAMTYYKLKADGQTLKLICTIEEKTYFDKKTDTYKSRYKIKNAGSSKYVKLSKKKFKKLEKKYKIIKEM